MDRWELAGSILGLFARGVNAAADAIAARNAANEDAAFEKLFAVIREAAPHVANVDNYLAHNKGEALKALRERFPVEPVPTPGTGDDGH